MVIKAIRETKWTIGNVIAAVSVFVIITGAFITTIKWVKGTDKDIKINKQAIKDNKHDIENLQKCERDATISITEMKVLIDELRKSVRRLENP